MIEKGLKESASRVGDIIITGSHNPVIINSTVIGSFNAIAQSDPGLAEAIKTLGGYIEQSGNKEAADYFNRLHENIASPKKDRITLKALWLGITAALPGVTQLIDVVAKITALF